MGVGEDTAATTGAGLEDAETGAGAGTAAGAGACDGGAIAEDEVLVEVDVDVGTAVEVEVEVELDVGTTAGCTCGATERVEAATVVDVDTAGATGVWTGTKTFGAGVVDVEVVVVDVEVVGTSPGGTQIVVRSQTVSTTSSVTVNHTISRFSTGAAAAMLRTEANAMMLKDFMIANECACLNFFDVANGISRGILLKRTWMNRLAIYRVACTKCVDAAGADGVRFRTRCFTAKTGH